jgi:pimeloyl-ACP methyl ester carboxylesterase
MLFLHGILGTRANWRGVARRFVEGRDGWGAVLVDLREHGESLGFRGPHTVSAAAADVADLVQALDLPIRGALGHSFGGKVVLEWLEGRRTEPTEAWIIDASPSAISADRESTATGEVLRTLARLPRDWPSREAFVDAIIEAGQPEAIAQWLAMNLKRTEHGRRSFGPELAAIRSLAEDYARRDLWKVIEHPPLHATLDFVVGGRSSAFSPADRVRLKRIVASDPRVSLHELAEAGHWVHVDAPDALVALLISRFASHGPGGS